VAGAVFIVGGIRFLWEMVKPIKKVSQNKSDICPFCGAIIKKDDTVCTKCDRQLTG